MRRSVLSCFLTRSDMTNIIEKSFRLNIAALRVMGLYPQENNTVLLKLRAYALYLLLLVLITALTFRNIVVDKSSDIMRKNFMTMYLVEIACFCFKVLPFLINGKRIKKCINYFGDQRFAPKDEEELKITNECVTICRRNFFIYFFGCMFSELLWTLPLLFRSNYEFPIDIWLPFDAKSNPVIYYPTFLFGFIALTYDGLVSTLIDPLMGGLTYHATCQLKLLNYNLQHLNRTKQPSLNKNHDEFTFVHYEDVHKALKNCVRHYDDILNFVAEYEKCFSWPIFCQVAGTVLAMSFSLIGIILGSVATIDGFKNLVALFCFPLQIVLYCYYGTLLLEENNGICDSIYMGNWYEYDVKIRTMLIIIMERSKRPLIITSGKIINLTLQTFVSVLRTSYSLIAVFNNYYN